MCADYNVGYCNDDLDCPEWNYDGTDCACSNDGDCDFDEICSGNVCKKCTTGADAVCSGSYFLYNLSLIHI